MNAETMFNIDCPNCGAPSGKPCSHWEGTPVACTVRADAVRLQLAAHEYPPVYDSLLKAWVNNPPHGRPGQGAKE